MNYAIIRNTVLSLTCLVLVSAFTSSFAADGSAGPGSASHREGKWQGYFGGNYTNSTSIDFNGGASADIDGDLGFIFGLGYNFTEKLALDFDMGWVSVSYKGTRENANTSARETFGGTMDASSTRFNLTYNFMAKRLTPFIAGNIGWTWIDSNIPSGPSTGGCWWDPWYGYICSSFQPTYGATEFTYGGSLGVRYDVNNTLFLRGLVGKQWLDVSTANGTPDFTSYRVDIGFMF